MDKKQENSEIFPKIAHHSIPKWSDLPEIDLYMDQVIALMEKYLIDTSSQDAKLITPSMINNYVKLGIMPAPVKKKYSREHLAYLVIICSLKQVMSIPNIKIMIDKKLKNNTISEILDFYSDLYDFTYNKLLDVCSHYLGSNDSKIKTIEDTSLFAAIAAANCRNISNKLFYHSNPQSEKKESKKKNKDE